MKKIILTIILRISYSHMNNNITTYFFKISKNKNIPNTSLRCLNFGLSVEGLFSFYYKREIVRDSR